MTAHVVARMIRRVGRHLPSGTVTFLFTDVEGSTRLLHALGADAYAAALTTHRTILRDAFARHGGVEVDTEGDAFFVAFPTAPGALAAAREATDALADGPIQVRIGLHTGTPLLGAEGYIGPDVHRGARIGAAGHGGQVLVSAATAALLEGATLKDLGLHRLKDLSTPERIYQLGDAGFPPLRTLHQTNLPIPVSSFIGRKHEVAEVVGRLRDGDRLLTLTGPGGAGKTRLAIAAASDLVPDHPDGVFWIGLAELADPDLAMAELARVVDARTNLAEHIGGRRMLLVLDNLEQVIGIGARLPTLAEACPNLRIIATSRERLHVRGEREFPVPPLAESDAIALFEDRAGTSGPIVGELVRRLDNLPLAVELAAARARVLTPAEILERLEGRLDLFRGSRDADARQRTLRAAIEWSHELLDADAQRLFARLAVFRGGWSLEAAERVVEADLENLASLVEKSLVTRNATRFGMLETLRVFAEERLIGSDDELLVRSRHLAYYVEVAEAWYDARFASESRLLPLVDIETDNLRAAFDWAIEQRPADAARLIGAVSPLWHLRGLDAEAKQRLGAAVVNHTQEDASRARAVMYLAELDDDVAGLEEARRLWRTLDDAEGEAVALECIGWAQDVVGDYVAARAAYEESLRVRARAGSPHLRGLPARAGLCHVLVAVGDTAAAAAEATELLSLARRNDAVRMEELALHFLADCTLIEGRWAEAEARYRTALAYAHESGLVRRMTDEVIGIAMALAGAGEHGRATWLASAAHAKQAEIGMGSDAWWSGMQERLLGTAPETAAAADRAGAPDFEQIVDELVAPETASTGDGRGDLAR